MWAANKQVVFDGDGYSEAWHKEAEKRGLANLRTTPDALPWLIEKQTVAAFKKYKVLSKRELESRYEVFTEQYATNINIESETAVAIARTMLLPAAVRYLNELRDERPGGARSARSSRCSRSCTSPCSSSRTPTSTTTIRTGSAQKEAVYMRDTVIAAMEDVRDVADRLEKLVADDLWPLPKYSEMLFIK